ncbi:MAG: hypothetical protein KGQ93_02025 [Cyanobacteria bacterium REEB459]|nr:hypothetical protein [Cyanobacteria bacterium REEB459]
MHQLRSNRSRSRSKRRAIYCPSHGCPLESVSCKHQLYADRAEQLQQRGMGRRTALTVIRTHTAVPITGEWLEAFWCPQCQEVTWYHVWLCNPDAVSHQRRQYVVRPAPQALWQQATGVIDPDGNPSVGEFTRTLARMTSYQGLKGFRFI